MKLCFFGGTFDPPHRGHLKAARAAADHFSLDQVLLTPANIPPHKQSTPVTDYAHRLAMVTLAVKTANDPRLVVSDIESPARTAGRPNYSLYTIRALRESLEKTAGPIPPNQIYFLLGADAFHGLPQWHHPEELARLCEFIVVSRPGYDSVAALASLPPELRAASTVHTIDTVMEDVSATEVRRRVVSGHPLDDLITPEITAYIREYSLYRG